MCGNCYFVACSSYSSECLALDLADAAWRHTDDLCSRGKSERGRGAKPDPQADNLLLMRFQHRDQPLDGSMVGDRPLYIALCKPSCDQLHGRFHRVVLRSEEHTSELQSLMRTSYAVFCLKIKNHKIYTS